MEINNMAVDILIIAISIIVGFLAGYFAVYAFNKFPGGWFCDYGESTIKDDEDDEKFIIREGKRVRSYPWKPALAMIFTVICIKLGIEDWQFAIPAIIAIWVLVEIIIADRLYMIIPDQFIILLAVTGFGFIPFYDNFLTPVWGALLGLAPMILIYLIGKLLFRKEIMGFGDVKLMTAIGFLLGPIGVLFTFIIGFISSGAFFGIALLMKKVKLKDEEPLGPFLGIAAILYLVFYKDLHMFLNIV
ncbi:MAG TPA: A24 family peptidase [Anaerovoracaceae bacterium]|nr:A24 family peptidase [Anaerovoracaceae bacterium]